MPGLAPAGDLLFFASPKKPKEKKGDPQSGPLCGSLKKRQQPENLETCLLRSLRTSKFFIPATAAISSPARTGLADEFGITAVFTPNAAFCAILYPRLCSAIQFC